MQFNDSIKKFSKAHFKKTLLFFIIFLILYVLNSTFLWHQELRELILFLTNSIVLIMNQRKHSNNSFISSYVLQEDRRAEVKRSWNLREVSLIHQKYLVIAEIAWEPRRQIGSMRKPFYFVTWEVDGGGLKGNLLTESTTVTLSLCTDTVYHIQVCAFIIFNASLINYF